MEASVQIYRLANRMFMIAAIAFMPTILVVGLTAAYVQNIREKEFHAEALKSAELAALEMQRILDGTENILRAVAEASDIQRHDATACAAYLDRVVEAVPHLASIGLINTDGSVWCRPEDLVEPLLLADRPYFSEALAEADVVIGVYTEDRLTLKPVLPIALQHQRAGETPSVVVGYIDLRWLQNRLDERTRDAGSSLTIADRDGRILARSPQPEKFVGTLIPEPFQRLVRSDRPGTEALISQDGTSRIVGYVPSQSPPKGIYVSSGLATEQAFGLVWRLVGVGSLIALVGFAASLFLVWATSRAFVVRPFNRVMKTVDAWRAGETDRRSGMTAKQGEIGSVGAALDAFMDELVVSRAERRRAEEQKHLMSLELNHRVKNLMSVINVVVRQTFGNPDAKDPLKVFSDRLRAIGESNDILARDNWHAASIREIVDTAIAPFRDDNHRFELSGPKVMLSSASSMGLGMALHELCTNAGKYGALSTECGRVKLSWVVSNDGEFQLCWFERGGPPVKKPSRTGFGSKVITQVLESQIGGKVEIHYEPEGLTCEITAPLEKMAPLTSQSVTAA
jgi:two-component sensor histidine kinase